MSKLVVSLIDQQFPPGTVPAGIKVSVTKADGTEAFPATVLPVGTGDTAELPVPADLPVGTYTVTTEAVDPAGTTLGSAVSNTFDITPVTIKVPQSVTLVTV